MHECPKCDALVLSSNEDDYEYIFDCGTIYCGGRCDSQSPECYFRQTGLRIGDEPDDYRDYEDDFT